MSAAACENSAVTRSAYEEHDGGDDDDSCTSSNEPTREEDWGLPQDFSLFAEHEFEEVFYSSINDRENSIRSFKIQCIVPNSPLDIMNKSKSEKQYDATGHCVWAGAFLLIHCIDRLKPQVPLAKKRVIEFGCGTGIGGLALMLADELSAPSVMYFTDNDPAALRVCERNCSVNNLSEESYAVKELSWGCDISVLGEPLRNGFFDVALATDVLYDVDLIDPLFTSVGSCVREDGIFILSHIPRACYNDNNPPEAIQDLEKYIIDQAANYGLDLITTISPPREEELQENILK
eukprot:CAMPEP_0196819394 /NCGR_PEP_ID=MMETSP1362-20130617/70370_1 /TAXON_ID=163516 /ORGANISM="Leptocylindrus danicus, Strain CCMP1856" /LENGTH=290 /DNA_ID=CAMNT_0042197869 /DNA_START=6 /DNA_END=875 /DNA_ORIENTATION=-